MSLFFVALASYLALFGLANAGYPGNSFTVAGASPSITPSVLTDWLNQAQTVVRTYGIQNQVS